MLENGLDSELFSVAKDSYANVTRFMSCCTTALDRNAICTAMRVIPTGSILAIRCPPVLHNSMVLCFFVN